MYGALHVHVSFFVLKFYVPQEYDWEMISAHFHVCKFCIFGGIAVQILGQKSARSSAIMQRRTYYMHSTVYNVYMYVCTCTCTRMYCMVYCMYSVYTRPYAEPVAICVVYSISPSLSRTVDECVLNMSSLS